MKISENCKNCNCKSCERVAWLEPENIKLQKENEELKTVHKQLKQMIKSKESLLEKAIQENAELKYEIDRQKDTIIYLNNLDMLHKTLLEYKTALEKIREKCKQAISDFGLTNDNTWEYCIITELINKILDDSEVLE